MQAFRIAEFMTTRLMGSVFRRVRPFCPISGRLHGLAAPFPDIDCCMPTRYMMHDERNYADPDVFYPERFQHPSKEHTILEPSSAVFGFGRRYVIYSINRSAPKQRLIQYLSRTPLCRGKSVARHRKRSCCVRCIASA